MDKVGGSTEADRPRGASDLFGSVPFALKRHRSPHGQVSAVSMMKDEGPYLIEWVAHHLAVGFTDLVVYTNDCSDGTDDMLIRLEELGLAHHRRNVIPEGLRPQPSALSHAQDEPVVTQSDWVMVFDADEFVSIRYGDGTLDDLLAAAKARGANGIVATWRVFGSGGRVEWSRDPVTEQYLRAAPVDWNKGWGVKTLFTFDPDYWKLGIHRPKMKTKHLKTGFPDTVRWLNGSGREMEEYFKFRGWRSISRTVGYDWVQVNHYAVKSVESYALRRLRGNVNNKVGKYGADYWALQDRNEVADDTMLRYSQRRGEIMAALLADPVLRGLHDRAVERAEARLAELRATEAYRELVAELAAAGQRPLDQIVAKPPQPRDREKIAALMSEVERHRTTAAREARKARAAVDPVSRLVQGARLSPDFAGEWVENSGVRLPADPAFFAPKALGLVGKGKLDRALARRLTQIVPQGDVVLDLDASFGFVAVRLSQTRLDLTLWLHESDEACREALPTILRRNGIDLPPDRCLSRPLPDADNLSALLSQVRPGTLLVSQADLSGEALAGALAAIPVRTVILHGAFLARAGDSLDAAFVAQGYQVRHGAEPAVLRGYARP